MAATFPRYNYIISRTADPILALGAGISAAGIRIRREENEKRAGMDTSSIVSPAKGERGSRQSGQYGKVGFGEIARVGWERVWRRVTGEVKG